MTPGISLLPGYKMIDNNPTTNDTQTNTTQHTLSPLQPLSAFIDASLLHRLSPGVPICAQQINTVSLSTVRCGH